MSNKSTFSLNSIKDLEKIRDTIPCRIEFIKELLKGKNLDPLVDFENTDTEYFIPGYGKDENASGESYDTRIVLKKRFHNFTDIILQIGGKLKYIKSGTTGHTFKGETTDEFGTFEYGVKVVAYPMYTKKDNYPDFNDIRRPENAELMMIKLLSYFVIKKQTPHIALPIGTFDTNIDVFIDLIKRNVVDEDNEKYNEFIKRHKDGEFYNTVSILISEWANRGDLLDYVRKKYKNFSAMHWKVIFFQILSVLAVIQSKYPAFRHNDMKANNILIHKITKQNKNFNYTIMKCHYEVPNIGYQIKLWDFDFACIPGIVDNKKVEESWTTKINVKPVQNKYYDIHYFFNTLIRRGFCPEIMTSPEVPHEVKEFINRVVPKKYQKFDTEFIHKKGRILVNDEYTTPDDLLKYDPYFEEFRKSSKTEKNITKSTNTKNQAKHLSNMPDLTKFLKSDSDDKKKVKSKPVRNTRRLSKSKKKRTISDDINEKSRITKHILNNTTSSDE
jgi:hypothetical protein